MRLAVTYWWGVLPRAALNARAKWKRLQARNRCQAIKRKIAFQVSLYAVQYAGEPASPPMLSSQRGPAKNKDGRRDQTLLRLQDPVRAVIVLRIVPGVVQIFDIRSVVAATHAARRDDRRPTHTGICIHRVAMMSPMRSQRGRSGESEDSKTDKDASGHSQFL
jgi:hypothetical protein